MNRTTLAMLAAVCALGCEDQGQLDDSAHRLGERLTAAQPASARFLDWAERYLAAPASERSLVEREGLALARARREELLELIRADPERALALALPRAVGDELPEPIAALLEQRVDGVGRFDVLCALPEDEPGPMLLERFVEVGGRSFRAFTYGRRADARSKERLVVHGIALDDRLALFDRPLRRLEPGERPEAGKQLLASEGCSAEERIAFDAGDAVHLLCDEEEAEDLEEVLAGHELSPNPLGPQASPWTTGQKRLLYIRVDFSDDVGEPLSVSQAEQSIAAVNTHLKASSYDQVSLVGTVTPTFRMPRPKSQYASANATTQLMQDARSAASAGGFPGSGYELDVIAFRKVSSWSWAGLGYIGQKGTWLNGSYTLRTTSHELGHNLGLHHANFWQAPGETIIGPGSSVEYGNPFEMMGGGTGHFNAWYKRYLEWLGPSEVETVASASANTSFRLFDLEAFTTGGLKGVTVPVGGGRAFWVEYRAQGSAPLQNGASVNWGYSTPRSSNVLDMTPWTQSANDSPLAIGRTFGDENSNVFITPTGKGGTNPESLDVSVFIGPFTGNRSPTVTLTASATQVAKGAQVTFTAAAADADGDGLAYHWDFGDGSASTNSAAQARAWSTDREVLAHVTVSDLKGGLGSAWVVVRVGNPNTLRIGGHVRDASNNLGVEGVRVSAGGRSTRTDSSGEYAVVGMAPGSYSVSATKSGWTLSPSGFSNPVPLSSASASGIDFSASRATYSISGTVTSSGAPLQGVTVSAGSWSAVTDLAGGYVISGVPNGSYAVVATLAGATIQPANFTNPVLVAGASLTGRNFVELAYEVSGEVSGAAGPHTISDGTRTTQTSLNGGRWTFRLARVPPGSWNLTASAPGLTLTPSFTNPLSVSGNLSGMDFTAAAGESYFIRGKVSDWGQPLLGASVSDGTRSGQTDSLGQYVLSGVPAGTYTLTPYKSGYQFTPATLSATVAGGDSLGNDFEVLAPNRPPTIAVPPHPSESPVTGTTVTLNVLGADEEPEQTLTYTWRTLFGPAAVSFSHNGDNSAKSTLVSFSRAGAYSFEVTLEDLGGLKTTASVTATVAQAASSLTVTPATATVEVGAERQFVAGLSDQFGAALDFGGLAEWSATGGGSIGVTGKFTATTPGDWVVTAAAEGKSGSAQVRVVVGAVPRVVQRPAANPNPVAGDTTLLTVLGDDDGGEEKLTYTWSAVNPPGAVSFSPNGNNAAKSSVATFAKEGTYDLQIVVSDERGLSASDFVTVVVGRGLTRIDISPQNARVAPGGTLGFSAVGRDQTGAEVSPAPSFTWSVSGGGTIDSAGRLTAGSEEGSFTVTATSGLKSASAAFSVGAPLEQPGPGPEEPRGCGCGTGSTAAAPWLLALLAFAFRSARAKSRAGAFSLLALLSACAEGPTGAPGPTPAASRQELGEVVAGYPSDQERMLHVLINQARHSPTTPRGECGDWTAEVGADVKKPPLVWEHSAGVAARFMARHMSEVGCYQHESCCELGDAGSGVGCVAAGACSGSGCNKTCDAGTAGAVQTRYGLFGFPSYSGESISQGPTAAYDAWCAWMQSSGNRQSLYGDHTQLGVGGHNDRAQSCSAQYWVAGFGNAQVTVPKVPAASAMYVPPNPVNTWGLYFAASYYDPSGKAPKRAAVVVNGHCFDLERAWGYDDNGTYEARFGDPDVLPDGCHPYYFLFLDGDESRVTYPSAGSLQVALGAGVSCPLSYDPSPQLPADCETGVQQCPTGAQRACYTQEPATLAHGECRQGYQVCREGFWSSCRDMIGPFPEACDGLDNDCDGETDEGNPGGSASCEVLGERGPCKAGRLECTSGRLTCLSVVEPENEACDGVDNDCDGVVDDGFGLISCGKGECFRMVQGCFAGVAQSCTPGEPEPEVAGDYKDNDCDGVVDNGFDCRLPDGGGVGRYDQCFSFALKTPDGGVLAPRLPCKPGLRQCQADGGWTACLGEVGPAPEVCDGADNDCDTVVDENDEIGWERCGEGACLVFGAACRGGSPVTCTPKTAGAERCNGVDDDCDGTVDEGCACREGDSRACYTGKPQSTRDAGVCHGGTRPCVDGQYSSCSGEVVPGQEYCNGLDDDCDGEVDDGCVELPDAGGAEDSGTTPEDGGAPSVDAGGGEGEQPRGCGCGASAGALPWLLIALLTLLGVRSRGASLW